LVVVPEAFGSVPLDVPELYGASGPPPLVARAWPVSSALAGIGVVEVLES
jgi:hypothetical protein